ncbi:hypothetical protein TIFTF001_002146 [Ficus carica]|uniref:Lethal giant larvae (Lgl)-like C-terminal domain-containing protein n=1 Tax=Ficus carica TaxID=3494 RepID=A0AA87Z321_FICCA|nr:hypothetical protein TIFTF001_002146 [Ficus carica]
MFVKKLVEKASIKKSGGNNSENVKESDVEPRLVFHHGIPRGSSMDGRIKLFGRDNTQALLQSKEAEPTKFLQVWDVENKVLSHVHAFQQEITSFTIMQQSPYMYIGDSVGNVSVVKLEKEPCHIVRTNYNIPYTVSHGKTDGFSDSVVCNALRVTMLNVFKSCRLGNSTEVSAENAVTHILPQPMAESKRVLIIFRDGLTTLWDIRESKSIFTTGGNGNVLQSLHHEATKVTSACWACPFGTRVVVGYNNGEIFIWGIPSVLNSRGGLASDSPTQNAPICKLNVGYKLNKIPIASLKWAYADGKASRLYVMGASNFESENLPQVVLLNEHTESRMIKLGLHLAEPCSDMEIISGSSEQGKHRQDCFLLVGKSGHIYAYDDCSIEKYLLQCQSRSHQSLPKEVMVKLPFVDSSITAAKFITDNPCLEFGVEDYVTLAKDFPHIFSFENKTKDGSTQFNGFSKVRNLYITGHSNGAITFCDVSSPILIPVLSLKQQSEDDTSLSGIAVTALFFDRNAQLLVSGDQSGTVRIYKLKPEPYGIESSFLSLQGSTKKGNSHIIDSIKLITINGAILCINISQNLKHLAIGSDQGYVAVVDIEGPNLLYQQHIESELCTGIISLQFQSCSLHGFEKNVLAVGTKDSSVLALDSDTGNKLSSTSVHPKKPYKALFMHVFNEQDTSGKGNASGDAMPKQYLLLLCSEKALYLYSFTHVIQGVKKVICKKKFQTSCCWASTFYTSSEVAALALLFTNGRVEIRSLPELTLLKETWIRGFAYSTPKPNSLSNTSICSSSEGDIVMVNGDQEIFVVSVLSHKQIFRHLESASQVYRKDLVVSQEGLVSAGPVIHKEKKKGIFSSVIKDITGSKSKPVPDHMETEDARKSFKELETIFSIANFPVNTEDTENKARDEEGEVELDIDDIDIDIDIDAAAKKPKEQNMLAAALNKQNLANKFQVLKGKLKQMKPKSEKNSTKEEPQDEKPGTVDQIKKKYGFSNANETSVAKIAESKLQDNVKKFQKIRNQMVIQ